MRRSFPLRSPAADDPLLIREASPGDIPRMMAIERASASAAHWTDASYASIFRTASPRRVALVIETGALDGIAPGVHGFLILFVGDSDWEIENVVIDAAARRCGMADRLLGEALRLARQEGAERVFLEVRESNEPARRLYEKWGFVEAGRRRNYYRNPDEDALVLELFSAFQLSKSVERP